MDIKDIIESEMPDALELEELILERLKINKYKNELEDRRKSIDKVITQFCKDNDLDEITSDTFKAEIIERRGSARWNKDVLEKILTPFQIEEAYSIGKSTRYLKVSEKRG